MGGKGAELEIEDEIPPLDDHHAADHAGPLGKDGRQGRATRAQAEHAHHQQVQRHVEQTGAQHDIKRALAVAHAPEDGGQGVIAKDEHRTQGADHQIVPGLAPCLCRGLDQAHDGAEEDQHQPGDRQGRREQEKADVPDGPSSLRPPPRADMLADAHAAAHAKAHGAVGEQAQNRGGHIHPGQAHRSGKLAHDDLVRHAI